MATQYDIDRVNSKLERQLGKLCAQMRKSQSDYYWLSDGNTIMMKNQSRLNGTDLTQYDLVGIYNSDIEPSDLRDDLLWYIDNKMEAQA